LFIVAFINSKYGRANFFCVWYVAAIYWQCTDCSFDESSLIVVSTQQRPRFWSGCSKMEFRVLTNCSLSLFLRWVRCFGGVYGLISEFLVDMMPERPSRDLIFGMEAMAYNHHH
jgi:hypothetical protein